MAEFTVTMERADISDEEREKRIHEAYRFILSLRSKKRIDPDKAGNRKTGSAAVSTSNREAS